MALVVCGTRRRQARVRSTRDSGPPGGNDPQSGRIAREHELDEAPGGRRQELAPSHDDPIASDREVVGEGNGRQFVRCRRGLRAVDGYRRRSFKPAARGPIRWESVSHGIRRETKSTGGTAQCAHRLAHTSANGNHRADRSTRITTTDVPREFPHTPPSACDTGIAAAGEHANRTLAGSGQEPPRIALHLRTSNSDRPAPVHAKANVHGDRTPECRFSNAHVDETHSMREGRDHERINTNSV